MEIKVHQILSSSKCSALSWISCAMMLSTTVVFELLNDIGIDRAQLSWHLRAFLVFEAFVIIYHAYCCSFVGPSCVREIFHEVGSTYHYGKA